MTNAEKRMREIVAEYRQTPEYKEQQLKEQKEASKQAYKGRILQNKVRRRIQRIKNDPTASVFSVNSYENWLAMYKAGESWEKSSPQRVKNLIKELQEIDQAQTSRVKGARKHHKQAVSVMGESYTRLSREQQSNMWNQFNLIRSQYKTLDSDQVASLVKYGSELERDLIPETDFSVHLDQISGEPIISFINNNLDKKKQRAILQRTQEDRYMMRRMLRKE